MKQFEAKKWLVYTAAIALCLDCTLAAHAGQAVHQPAVVAQMQALIQKHSARPQFKPPGPPIDAAKLKGKTIAIQLLNGNIGALEQVKHGIQEAARKVGLKTKVFDAQSSPSRMQQGFQIAINTHADAIVNVGEPVKLIASKIKAAKSQGIPTVEVINSPPVVGVPGQGSNKNTFGNVSPDGFLGGKLAAAEAIVKTDGKARVVIMNSSELSASSTIIKGMKAALAKCSGCSVVETTDTPPGQWSTAITGLAATLVRVHPKVNYLLPIYSAMGIFATAGVKQAGATGRVHIASYSGERAVVALVKKGRVFTATMNTDYAWDGWAVVDQCMRGMLGMKPAYPVAPLRYVDTKSLQGVGTSTPGAESTALFGTAYKQGFMKLWGLN